MTEFPISRLKYVAEISPKTRRVADDELVSFVPMEAVSERGGLDPTQTRPAGEVRSGYTGFEDGDVVVAKITPCFENGKGALASGLVGGVGYGTTELHVLRPKDTEPRWLLYVTRSRNFLQKGEASMYGAGGQKRVPTDFVREFRTPVPPLYTQRAIADFLDRKTAAIDALIEKKQKLLNLLAEKRTALINRAVTKGLDPDVPMKDSGVPWIGEIPAHWEVTSFRRVLDRIEQGWSPQCEAHPATGRDWGVLKVGCVNYGRFDPDENKTLPADLAPRPRLKVESGDLLMSRANTSELVGSAALVGPIGDRRLMLCDKLYRLRLVPVVNERFVVRALCASYVRVQHEASSSGASSSMQNISQEKVRELVIALPPLNEQTAIADHVARKLRGNEVIAARVARQIATLREYRQALITAAVTGQIDVETV